MTGIDVHHRERQPAGGERLDGQVQHDDRVLAAGKQQHGTLELRGHLADDVDRFGFERTQMGQLVASGDRTVENLFGQRFLVKLVELTRFTCLAER